MRERYQERPRFIHKDALEMGHSNDSIADVESLAFTDDVRTARAPREREIGGRGGPLVSPGPSSPRLPCPPPGLQERPVNGDRGAADVAGVVGAGERQ